MKSPLIILSLIFLGSNSAFARNSSGDELYLFLIPLAFLGIMWGVHRVRTKLNFRNSDPAEIKESSFF